MHVTLAEDRTPRKAATEAKGKIQKIYKGKRAPSSIDELPSYFSGDEEEARTPATSGYQSASRRRADLAGTEVPGDTTDSANTSASTASGSGSAPSSAPSTSGQGISGNRGRPKMTNFEDENGTDANDAQQKMSQVKLEFDRKNIKKWIKRLEIRLEFCGVKSQWLKRVCLENMLPATYCECIGELFEKEKSEAGETIYKECKTQLLKVHGPRAEDDFGKAQTMVLTGLPSDAAKKLKELICQKTHKLDECCGATAISKLWRDMLPRDVKNAVANLDLTTQWELAMTTSDAVYRANTSNTAATPVAAVTTAVNNAAAALNNATPADLDTSADTPAFQAVNQLAIDLAAFSKSFKTKSQGRGANNSNRGNGRGNRQNRGAAGKPQPKQQTPQSTTSGPHPDGPPDNACPIHYKHGRGAYFCAARSTCPWKDIIAPRPQ